MFIGYISIPHFAAAIVRRDDPTAARQPLILVEEHSGRAAVYAACEKALACGVRAGIGLAQAQRLCPDARLTPATESAYLAVFEDCLDTLGLFTARVEPEGLGGAYLDLKAVVRTPDEIADFCRQLAGQLQRDQHLTPSMGVTTTMFGAAVAGIHIRPGLAFALPAGVERGFLTPFPTRMLPVGEEMVRRLQLLGLRRIGQYADLPSGVILNQFGWEGQRAHRLACGQDDRRVQPGRLRLVENVRHYFEDPIADGTVLAAVRDRLVTQLIELLRERYLAPQAMHLRLDFEKGPAQEVRVTFPAPTADEGELQRAGGRLAGRIEVRSRITEIQVGLSKLQPLMGRQLMLFPTQADREYRLRQVMENLARRYGPDGFRQPQIVDAGSPVLERRFVLNRWAAGASE
jgi:DNA polymerase-4